MCNGIFYEYFVYLHIRLMNMSECAFFDQIRHIQLINVYIRKIFTGFSFRSLQTYWLEIEGCAVNFINYLLVSANVLFEKIIASKCVHIRFTRCETNVLTFVLQMWAHLIHIVWNECGHIYILIFCWRNLIWGILRLYVYTFNEHIWMKFCVDKLQSAYTNKLRFWFFDSSRLILERIFSWLVCSNLFRWSTGYDLDTFFS